MDILDEAIIFATKAHSGSTRKGTSIPYIVHPLETGAIAATLTDDREVIAAAVLHDVVEDTEVGGEELTKRFGKRVASLVMSDSEDKMREMSASDSWQTRKERTLDSLLTADRDEQIIYLADKLSNIRAICRDYRVLGERLWERFNQKDKAKHAWYYRGIAERLGMLKESAAYEEYVSLLNQAFGNQ